MRIKKPSRRVDLLSFQTGNRSTPRYHRSVDDGALGANGARQGAGELLIESGAISRDGLEAFEPSPDQDAEWAQERSD